MKRKIIKEFTAHLLQPVEIFENGEQVTLEKGSIVQITLIEFERSNGSKEFEFFTGEGANEIELDACEFEEIDFENEEAVAC